MRSQQDIPAARGVEFRKILNELGMLELLESGELKCAVCGVGISWDNLGGLARREAEVVPVCSELDCIARVTTSDG